MHGSNALCRFIIGCVSGVVAVAVGLVLLFSEKDPKKGPNGLECFSQFSTCDNVRHFYSPALVATGEHLNITRRLPQGWKIWKTLEALAGKPAVLGESGFAQYFPPQF